jgi:hypothetical protein
MQLVLKKFNFSDLVSNKVARLMSYITLAVVAVVLFTAMNESSAITEAQLKTASTVGADNSGTVMNTPVLWVINFLKGTGGLFATVLAFVMTLYAAVIAKSLMGIIIAVGIGIAAVFGPAILMSIFGAAL